MKLYLAPMEALTGYIYRNAFNKIYGGADRYFTPFIASRKLNSKEKNDVLPEHNVGMDVIPQILTNNAEGVVYISRRLREFYGYEEVNINLGCPSGTVVAKNRGAGFLRVPDELDRFLYTIYEKTPLLISVKTRIGVENTDDWGKILEIYNKYPISELIIHPRCQKDFYTGTPDYDAFAQAVRESRHSLCYNGDINTVEDYNRITGLYPKVDKIMCGRGVLANPDLFNNIRGEENHGLLRAFHDEIYYGYKEVLSGDRNLLFKMKELWIYLSRNFDEPDKVLKKIRKCQTASEYEALSNFFTQSLHNSC